MARKPGVATAALVAFALALPAAASGSVTIGSNLNDAANQVIGGPGTWGIERLPAASRAAGGVVSPVNGVVTQWRIKWGSGPPVPVAFRIVRPVGTDVYTGAGTGPTQMPASSSISTFPVQLPISIGDRIGHNSATTMSTNNDSSIHYIPSDIPNTRMLAFFSPLLVDNGPARSSPPGYDGAETLMNADIEPTSTFNPPRLKKLKNGKVKVTVTLPNPGTFVAGGKPFKLKTLAVAAPGELTSTVKPGKTLLRKLRDTGKAKAKLSLSFTPTGGARTSTVAKVKLKA